MCVRKRCNKFLARLLDRFVDIGSTELTLIAWSLSMYQTLYILYRFSSHFVLTIRSLKVSGDAGVILRIDPFRNMVVEFPCC